MTLVRQPRERVDRIGIAVSSLCAVHCVVCALAPAAFAALGVSFFANPAMEWCLVLFAIGFAVLALFSGWPKHRSKLVVAFFVIGIAGLLASRGLEMASGHHHGEHHAHTEEHGHRDEHHGDDHHDEPAHDAHGHHDEHGGEHHAHAKSPGHHDDGHEASGGHEAEDEGLGHSLGALIGVLAGLCLLIGHVLSIFKTRRCDDGCADEC